MVRAAGHGDALAGGMNRWFREVDIADVIFVLLAVATIIGAWTSRRANTHDSADRCYRWLSAAATSRDTLWVTTLRSECAALIPPRMP